MKVGKSLFSLRSKTVFKACWKSESWIALFVNPKMRTQNAWVSDCWLFVLRSYSASEWEFDRCDERRCLMRHTSQLPHRLRFIQCPLGALRPNRGGARQEHCALLQGRARQGLLSSTQQWRCPYHPWYLIKYDHTLEVYTYFGRMCE